MAQAALETYGLAVARIKFVRLAGNVVFRVFESGYNRDETDNEPYEPGQYLLRIHDRSEQPSDAIKLEMMWLAAIRREAKLPVPEPVPALNGNLLKQISIPGIPEKHDCTLLRWLKGRYVTRGIKPHHFKAQGQLMAQLHNHAAQWQAPLGLSKRRFDWEGFFKDDVGAGIPNSEAWRYLPDDCLKPYKIVAHKIRQVMDKWEKGSDVYGLIHGDCGVDANVLFWKGKAHPIDFDGSGFGYYVYDLAITLEHCWEDEKYPEYRKALLDGYSEFRSLPDEQLKRMNLFLAAFYVYMGLWVAALGKVHPDSAGGPHRRLRWQERGLKYIDRFIKDY